MRYILLLCLLVSAPFISAGEEGQVLVVVSTRPDVIKMAPLYLTMKERGMNPLLCTTGQHREMAKEALSLFGMSPDYDFDIMKEGQDLSYITQEVLQRSKALFQEVKPSLVMVHGDTSSAMAAAMAAFYENIPVAHVEAGLRTSSIEAPFPEEMNRRVISTLATYHFAPTAQAVSNLRDAGVERSSIFCVGNTVVDSLKLLQERIEQKKVMPTPSLQALLEEKKQNGARLVLLTTHRRESLSGGIESIFEGVKQALEEDPSLFVVYPVHPNPLIKERLEKAGMDRLPNLALLPPLAYHDFIYTLGMVEAVATDSGGVQEEAVSMNKPTFVFREECDRPEALGKGAVLVGTKSSAVLHSLTHLPEEEFQFDKVYGKGTASREIVDLLADRQPKTNLRVLVGSPICQTPEILNEFFASLKRLSSEGLEIDFFFVDDNKLETSRDMLTHFQEEMGERCWVFHYQSAQNAYFCNETTHFWNEDLVWKVAGFKDRMIEKARNEHYDYLLLIDSDVVLHPQTVRQLISANQDIVANIFWTRWTPEAPLSPQVWVSDCYTLYHHEIGESLSGEEVNARTDAFLSMLQKPGTYKVGGLGACTLISHKALQKGASFKRIPNITMWGEDRHFCIRATALGLSLAVDTHYPAYHIYREKDVVGVQDFIDGKIIAPHSSPSTTDVR